MNKFIAENCLPQTAFNASALLMNVMWACAVLAWRVQAFVRPLLHTEKFLICVSYGTKSYPFPYVLNPLTPNDHYSGRTAPLTSKRCILYIYSNKYRY